MIIFTALVIGDLSPDGITSFASEDPEVVRKELVEFHNQAVRDGGLSDEAFELPEDCLLYDLQKPIRDHLGRVLVFLEMEVL